EHEPEENEGGEDAGERDALPGRSGPWLCHSPGRARAPARSRTPISPAAARTSWAIPASAPSAGRRYDGPWTWIAATTSPRASAIGAATELIPTANSSRTQA